MRVDSFSVSGVHGALTSYPADNVVRYGQTAEFKCTSDGSEPVNWFFKNSTISSDIRIVSGGSIIDTFLEKYELMGNAEVLIVHSTSKEDVGTYKCIDNVGYGDAAYAELVALGNWRSFVQICKENCQGCHCHIFWQSR